ncbi:MAG TPA: endonuclease/exonuclease/phosphatase family protein [Actinobacteria bacterium]|nr:endonuclease/exonuclease/phosphatase family protein [Actinomycetota bacterium]
MPTRRRTAAGLGFRTFFGLVVLLAGIGASVLTVAGFLGDLWWPFDLAADHRMQYFGVLVLAAILYGLAFGRGTAVVFAAAAAVNAVVLAPLWLAGTTTPPEGAPTVRIVLYDAERAAASRPLLLRWLADLDADVVVLQGTTPEWSDPIAEADLPFEPVIEPAPGVLEGTTVLASVPAEGELVTVRRSTFAVVEVDGDTPYTLVAVESNRPDSQAAHEARLDLFSAAADRATQTERPVVVVGSLGTTRWSKAFSVFTDAGLRSTEDGFGYQPTWMRADLPLIGPYFGIPVDHILVGPGIRVVDRSVGPELAGPHRPVTATLHLRP